MTDQNRRMESLKHRYRRASQAAPQAAAAGPGPGGPGGPNRRGGMHTGKRPKNSRETVRRLLSYIREDKAKMLLAFVCVILNTIGTLL